MNKGKWEVGGDDVLKRLTVSRQVRTNETASAREWVMDGDRVMVFDERDEAQKTADKLNR